MISIPESWPVTWTWFVQTTLEACVLIIVVRIVQLLLGKRLSPRWHHALWLLVLARMVMPWMPASSFSIFNFLPASIQESPVQFADADRVIFPAAPYIHIPAVPIEYIATPAVSPPPTELNLMALLPTIWGIGMAVLLLYVLWRNISFSRMVRRAPEAPEPRVQRILRECMVELGVEANLSAVVVPGAVSPALVGLLRPRIILPKEAYSTFEDSHLRHVFIHELCHYKRHDILLNWMVTLMQVVHWMNPLVWYAFFRMRLDREIACDALALSHIEPNDAQNYGMTILKVSERLGRMRAFAGVVGISENSSQITRRISAIARFKRDTKKWTVFVSALFLILVGVLLTDAQAHREDDPLDSVSDDTAATFAGDVVERVAQVTDTSKPAPQVSGLKNRTEKALETSVTIVFENIHITDLVDFLSDTYKINFVVDQRAVGPRDLDPDSAEFKEKGYTTNGMISYIGLRKLPVSQAIDVILARLGLAYAVYPAYVQISSPENIRKDIARAHGAETPTVPPGLANTPAEATAARPSEQVQRFLEAEITIIFEQIHIREVFDFMSDAYDVNIVLDDRLVPPVNADPGEIERGNYVSDGRLDVNLKDVTGAQALNAMLPGLNLEYGLQENFIWVTSRRLLAHVPAQIPLAPQPSAKMQQKLDATVSIIFEDIHLSQLFDFLSDTFEVNFMIDQRVVAPKDANPDYFQVQSYATNGMIPYVNLRHVTLAQALSAVLTPLNLMYAVQDNFVWVTSEAHARTETFEELETVSYNLAPNMDKEALAAFLESLPSVVEPVTQKAMSFHAILGSNSGLVVHHTPTAHAAMRQFLAPYMDAEVRLLRVIEVPDEAGGVRAQIQTAFSKKWYAVGEHFEAYKLQNIDDSGKSCTLINEVTGREFKVSMPEQTATPINELFGTATPINELFEPQL